MVPTMFSLYPVLPAKEVLQFKGAKGVLETDYKRPMVFYICANNCVSTHVVTPNLFRPFVLVEIHSGL